MVTCVSTAGPSDRLVVGFLSSQREITKRLEYVALHSMFTCNCSGGINLQTGIAAVGLLRLLGRDICLHDWGKKITSAEKVF